MDGMLVQRDTDSCAVRGTAGGDETAGQKQRRDCTDAVMLRVSGIVLKGPPAPHNPDGVLPAAYGSRSCCSVGAACGFASDDVGAGNVEQAEGHGGLNGGGRGGISGVGIAGSAQKWSWPCSAESGTDLEAAPRDTETKPRSPDRQR